jgi:hypothetical protein
MTVDAAPRSVVLAGVRPWRHDLAGCLHACAATLLEFHGAPPLATLGAAWTFRHSTAQLRREEYYYPCPPGTSLLSALVPYHDVESRWHYPADADAGWREVRAAVLDGRPVAVAVDNYYLPFRPAYQDVHTDHLLVVHGFDEERGTVRVLDAVPPAYHGDIRIDELTAARDSSNAARHERDMFFTNHPIGNRWLDVVVRGEPRPLDRDLVRASVRRNIDGFLEPDGTADHAGLAGEGAFLADAATRLAKGEQVCDEVFVAAGAALACTAVHADWLALAGRTVGVPVLVEIGRKVDRLAHHWTAIRILAALTRDGTVSADRLRRRSRQLVADHERVLLELDHALPEL